MPASIGFFSIGFYDLANIHRMKMPFRIIEIRQITIDKSFFEQRCVIKDVTEQYELCFLEISHLSVENWCKASFCYLVSITPGTRSQNPKSLFMLFRKQAQCEALFPVYECFRIAGRSCKTRGDRQSLGVCFSFPQCSDLSSGDRYRIVSFFISGSQCHPVASKHFDRFNLQVLWIQLFKHVHSSISVTILHRLLFRILFHCIGLSGADKYALFCASVWLKPVSRFHFLLPFPSLFRTLFEDQQASFCILTGYLILKPAGKGACLWKTRK